MINVVIWPFGIEGQLALAPSIAVVLVGTLCLRVANDDAPGLSAAGPRQVEFPGPADRGPAIVHTELGVDISGVRPYGAQRHDELASDLRAVQVGSEQPEH